MGCVVFGCRTLWGACQAVLREFEEIVFGPFPLRVTKLDALRHGVQLKKHARICVHECA